MLQFSLRNLLIAVAAVAVGTAALLNANAWWVSLLWGAVLLMLALAGFVAFFRRAAQRAFWSGYVVAGSLYLLLLMYSVPQISQSNTWMPLCAPEQLQPGHDQGRSLGIFPVAHFKDNTRFAPAASSRWYGHVSWRNAWGNDWWHAWRNVRLWRHVRLWRRTVHGSRAVLYGTAESKLH